jgi:hypothetical protein
MIGPIFAMIAASTWTRSRVAVITVAMIPSSPKKCYRTIRAELLPYYLGRVPKQTGREKSLFCNFLEAAIFDASLNRPSIPSASQGFRSRMQYVFRDPIDLQFLHRDRNSLGCLETVVTGSTHEFPTDRKIVACLNRCHLPNPH